MFGMWLRISAKRSVATIFLGKTDLYLEVSDKTISKTLNSLFLFYAQNKNKPFLFCP